MESLVHNFGNYLEDSVKSDVPKEAGKLVKQIRKYLVDNVEDNTLNFAIAKIFDDPYNFLKFLIHIKDKANQKGWREVLSESIELLNHFLNNFYNKLKPYTLEIIKTCRTISTSNANANEKSKSINILCHILKHDSDIPIDDVTNIYESYFQFCGVHQKTTSAKVQRSVFVLLGIISNKYPYIITNQNNLVDTYVLQLKKQSESSEKDRDNNVVSGCMDGLSNILETFPVTSEESKNKVYNIVSKLLLSGSTRFDIRDVVKFISRHCSMFIENIYNDVPELWFETIKKWALSKGDNQKAGYIALEKFYEELANLLKTKTDQRGKKCFQFFFDYFLSTIKDDKADIIEVRLAIRGFGFFSVPCDQNLSQMFMTIVNRIEQDYFVQENPSIEQLEYLPDYIHCFSAILFQIGDYSFDQIDSLQQISVLMIKTFPKLSPIYHFSVFDSMILSMCYLYKNNPKYLENYLQRVVYQGVLWTCSHRTCFDLETIEENKTITYKSYLPLWRNLLNFLESNNSKYKDIHIDVKYSVVKMIYDELIKTLLLLINKLNLNTLSSEDIPITDPKISCQAEKLDDFIIFINAVDFYVDLFSTISNNNFKNWIKVYTNQIMLKSSKYVYVSGFYKLLKLGLQISDELKYFNQLDQKEDRKILFKKILSHLEKTLFNIHEFKDDLQLSCLQLLLTLPLSFVSPLLPTLIPVFKISLNVGRGYLKLAETAVDALEKWYKHFPKNDLKPLLKEVLPNLDPFLRSKGFIGDPDVKLSLLEAKKSKRSKKRKVLIEQDSELANLQNKILMFVGQLDQDMCLCLIQTEVEIEQVTWDKQPYLKFTLPYNEVKPNIYLDRIIPRILELSLSSGDQKTRITACELLHSVVIFILGTSRQMSMNELNQMSKLFEKIMLPVIQLGCDSNDVVRQLFNPLVFQMVHWYSSPLQLMSKETSVLIDILMEGISHPNNTSVRDLSGKCIKEFVIWTIKQSQKEDLEKNSQNIHIIVNKLCSFSLHPNSFKRLGSALAFNHLYTHLREELSMVDIYWVELMYSLMISLSLEDYRSKNNTQLDAALNHIERVLREKNNIFNKHSLHRRVPPEIKGPMLKDSILWILDQTASNKIIYRRKAIKLFSSLAPYVENCGCVKNFITKFVKTKNWYFDFYETDLQINLDYWTKLGTPEIIFQYFRSLLKNLDAYKYLFSYDIPDLKTCFEKTKLLQSIKYFLENILTQKLEQTLKLFKQYDLDYICLSDENELFYDLKSQIILAIFDYLLVVLDKTTDWCEILCQNYFWIFINHCIFEPNNLGFITDYNLPDKLSETLNKFCKKLPDKYLVKLVQNLTDYFKSNYNSDTDFNTNHISMSQRNILRGWLLIQTTNLKTKLVGNTSQYFDNSIQQIFNSLVKETDRKTGINLQSSIAEYADLHLQLCFKLTTCADILNTCLTNNEEIKHPDRFSNIFYGEYFLHCFEETIMNYIIQHKDCIKFLCRKWISFSNNTSMIILIHILKYLAHNPQIKKNINMNDFFETLMYGVYYVFKSSAELNLKERNFQIELLSHILRVDSKQSKEIGRNFEFIKKWFLEQLTFYPDNEIPKSILQFHTNVLCFLYCFTGSNIDEDLQIESTLDAFINKIISTPKDKLDNSDLTVLFKKLLDYLMISKSRIVLKPCIDILSVLKEEDNINIPKAIDQYLSSISPDDQYKSIIKVYDYCCVLSPENKYKITKQFLLTMLRFCHYNAFEEFYMQQIKTITDNLKLPLTNDSTPKDIVNKSMNLILIDALFTRIKVSNFVDKSCPITKTLFTEIKKGNELLKESMKLVNQILKEALVFEDDRKEMYRWYQCDALNSLISIVCNSKNPEIDEKLFRMLFFIVKPDKNIWKNIINIEDKIIVPQDFDKLPSRKKVFVNVRNEHQQKSNNQIHYIESQSLFNSTLSEDICKFDFTNTLVRSQDFEQTKSATDNSIGSVYLKSVDFNNHECMATIMSLINHIVDNKITVVSDDNNKNINLPLWVDDIKKLLIDSNVELNVRIFIARVVHNTQHVFKYFAKYLFEAVVKFITDKCTGHGINYFVADLVLMLISWSENIPISEISSPATELINFLMSNAPNDRLDMLKYNLEIIKTSVQIWKTIIKVPNDVILSKLQNGDEKLVGIHLSGIILANDLIPWSENKIDEFIKSVCGILNKERLKKFTKPCAELIGMILKYLDDNKLQNQFDLLNKQLDDIFRQANTDKLFHSLEQIQIHFPGIIDKHLRKLSMLVFNETDTTLKCICLKNILRRIDNNDAKRFTFKDVIDLLNMDDNDIRLLTLQIINKTYFDFKQQHQILVISAVIEHKNDVNSTIRFAVYEVLISVYKSNIEEADSELIKLCKPVLLSALIDSDFEVQEKIEQFWYDRYSSSKLTDKYEKFLVEIYSPDIENFYLGCVNFFLLHSCKDTPEYKKLMFEHPLSDCKFDEYQVMFNWRLQNTSLVPLFSNSFSHFSAPQLHGIRETNSIKIFTPTQSSLSLSLASSSSFLFDSTPDFQNKVKEKEEIKTFGRMFLNEKSRSLGYAKLATEKNIKTEQQRKERVKRKEGDVKMYRQYRKGDLPDVQIPYSALIDPLKILARRDAILSRHLYVMLFSGLVDELDSSKNFIQNFNEGILSIFSQSYMYVPNVIGAFLDASFENNKKKNIQKIYVDSDTLSNVCKNSGLLSIGCLLMEEYISSGDDHPSSSKRGCGNGNDEVKQWVKLADMYKELNEWDTVVGIFSSPKINSSSDISLAIQSEANSNWKEALNQYEKLLNVDTDSNRKDFYYESFFKCFANLSDWQNMSKTVCQLSDPTFWDGDWNQEKLLPWYMMSEVNLTLEGGENTIIDNLNSWMKDKDKSEYIKDKFCEELAILSLLQNDASASKHYTKNCFSKFLDTWSHLNPLFSKIRSKKLLNFQKIIDLNKYLQNSSSDLIIHWQNSSSSSYSLPSTETRTLFRQLFIASLEKSSNEENSEEKCFELRDIKLSCTLDLVNNAVDYNNYIVGRKYCKESKKYISSGNKLGNFKLMLAMSKVGAILAENYEGDNKLNTLTDSWFRLDLLSKKYANTYPDLQIESSGQIFKLTENILNYFKSSPNNHQEIITKIQTHIRTKTDFLPDLQNYGVNKLRSAVSLGEKFLNESENAKILNNLSEAYLALVIFAQNQEDKKYNEDIVKYVLRAMKIGSREARQIFPCLLQLPELNNNLLDIFKEECDSVPTWMFLLWIPQLLISLDSSTEAVEEIIERIAITYPQSLIYTYRLAREKYKSTHLKNITEKLDNLLSNTLVDKFLSEMSYMCIPELYFNYHLENFIKTYTDCQEIKGQIKKLSLDLRNRISQRDNFKSIENTLNNLEHDIQDISDLQDMKKVLNKIHNDNKSSLLINKNKNSLSTSKKLKHFSPWLANFKFSDHNTDLEIPGQYSGESKPLIKYHAKICSFNQKITEMNSLRKPFQITIFGNDSKEYSFLVKFGEDLRQDQRIQQLFSLTNNILKTDKNCQERNLFLEQYQVVPLTTSLGLIKVYENTKSLSQFMLHAVKDLETVKQYKSVQSDYISWIRSAARGAIVSEAEFYAKAALTHDKNEVNMMFNRFVNEIPSDILSKSFWCITMSPSNYTYLRHQFITSYAVMCVVHWLLGIGDRNQGNSLICLRTGRIVGIDFGYAFGAMAQHSLIPELIPFRLTPHILALMEPLKTIGILEGSMVHVLKALRKKKHLLLSTMDVFLKDPTLDWLESTKTLDNDQSEDLLWHPNFKMDIVTRKLNGANSAAITIRELRAGVINLPKVKEQYVSIVKGTDSDVRGKLNTVELSEEDQVKCLLDHATDYNILGRQYAGLELWM